MWYASKAQIGEEAIFWCCTGGGQNRQGQIFRYFPSPDEGKPAEADRPGEMELYLEPNDSELLRNGDNITIAPWGDLIICEDTKGSNAIRGVRPNGCRPRKSNSPNDSKVPTDTLAERIRASACVHRVRQPCGPGPGYIGWIEVSPTYIGLVKKICHNLNQFGCIQVSKNQLFFTKYELKFKIRSFQKFPTNLV